MLRKKNRVFATKKRIKSETKRDTWIVFQILAQIILGFSAAIFTVFFGWNQLQTEKARVKLAQSNIEISRTQIKVSLIPALTSKDPQIREMALNLADILDKEFSSEVSKLSATRDSDKIVQDSAIRILKSLEKSQNLTVKKIAESGLNQYDIKNIIEQEGLQGSLKDAKNYLEGGSADGFEKAIKIYRSVLLKLPYEALVKLDRSLLLQAQYDEENRFLESAAIKYMSLFPNSAY